MGEKWFCLIPTPNKKNTVTWSLKERVEKFARSLTEEQLRRMARHTRRRAELCVAADGGYFEHLL